MRRILSVWLPAWPIERMARVAQRAGLVLPGLERDGGELPFALVENGVHGLTLTAVTARAWREGLRPGQALADARAAHPALLTRAAEPERTRAALAALALWAGRYGPARNVEDDDGLWIDVTGVAHLFGGEARLAADLVGRLGRAGLTARAGLADTPGAAFALARFAATPSAPWRVAAPGTARETLAGVSVEALRLPRDNVVLLHRLGLVRIGQLYGLPRDALAQRFRTSRSTRAKPGGKRERQAALMAGAVLARLDQALGLAPEPRIALEEPPLHLARAAFAEPLISAAGVAAALEALAHELGRLLAGRGEGGTRFTLGLYRADGSAQRLHIGASRPCRDGRHLMALLAEKLDTLDAGFGVDAMTLACDHAEPHGAHQITLAGADADRAATETAALLDRLSNRLGAARIFRLARADSHLPERAQRRVSVLAAKPPAPEHPPLGPAGDRPAFLLPAPEPITVLAEVPEGPPLRFTWRRLTRRVARSQGPERIAPEWWRAIGRPASSRGPLHALHLDRPRDYYRVEDEQGGRFWLFRAGLYGGEEETETLDDAAQAVTSGRRAPVWFMHGVFG